MKPVAIVFLILISLVYALPFQEPVVGVYRCFASQEGPFEASAQDIGATLELLTPQTYRFITGSASEEGSITAYTFESEEATFDALWQSASVLSLQPNSGSAAYGGAFFTDRYGGQYIIIQNNNALYIRCESEWANIAAIFENAQEANAPEVTIESTANESTPITSTDSSETLQALQAFKSGTYNCYSTFETTFWASSDDPSYYPDDDPDYFAVLFFNDGNIVNVEKKDEFNSDFEKGGYRFDATQSKVSIQGGNLGGLTLSYGTNTQGVPALSYIRTEREQGGTDKEWVWTYACEYYEDIPAGMSVASFENGTPEIDLGNITSTASKYDPTNPDPNHIPMIDTYYCYPSFNMLEVGEGFARYLREYQLEILANNRYSFNGSEGEFRTGVDGYLLQWLSGPLNPTGDVIKGEEDYALPHSAGVSYDTWGSEIHGVDVPQDTTVTVDCFQQGAREQKALLDFALKQPAPARYTCLPSGDNPQPMGLEILPDNRYQFNYQEGSYHSSVDEYSTDIIWESGPLAGNDTRYNADDTTGLRNITFTTTETFMGGAIPTGSSTTQTMACQAVVKANLIPKYATTTINLPPAGSGGLDGFYAKAEYDQGDILNGVALVTNWDYYHFLASGYVYQEGYVTSDECSKTYPNGLPVCQGYSYSNNQITLSNNLTLGFTQADGGNILLDGVLYENKTLSGPQTLKGIYEYVRSYSSPMYMQVAGMATNSASTSRYTFSADGTYSYSFDSWSQTSAPAMDGSPVGTIGALSSSGSSDSDSGNYTINGNVITFNSVKGYTTKCTFFYPRNNDVTSVNICGTDYDPPSSE